MLESRRSHRSRGQALVELAIVLPVMLLLILGALDLGRVFYAQITLWNSAKEGALVASQGGASGAIIDAAVTEANGGFVEVNSGSVTPPGTSCEGAAFGTTVSVTVEGPFRVITPFIGAVVGGQDLTLQATAEALCLVVPAMALSPAPPPCVEPTVAFDGSPKKGDGPLTVAFSATSTGTPLSWSWSFGDGGTSNAQNPTHTYPDANKNYDVALTVSVGSSCSATLSKKKFIDVD